MTAPAAYRRSEHRSLKEAKARCHGVKNKDFAAYGGRGIRVCEAWRGPGGFAAFYEHIGPKPTPAHSLDRIDPDGNYEPGNVRWATVLEQNNNRRSSLMVTWRGETLSAADWARRVGLRRQDVSGRIRKGWTPERALTTPVVPFESDLFDAATGAP